MTVSNTASNNNNAKTFAFLRSIPIFASLTDDQLSSLMGIIEEKKFFRNNVILWEEDTQRYMYIVSSGKVKVVQSSEDGKEHILAIHKKGEYFGEMAILDGKTAPATVIAMEDSLIQLIARESFEKFLLQNEKVMNQLISMLCHRLRESWLMLKVMSFSSAEQRVRAVLDQLGKLNGVRDERGIIIALKLMHKDIAGYANVSRETVTRLLNRFAKESKIEILDNKYILLKEHSVESR
ncbi:transcriptional regulator, Crp/Fnr family [Geotalea daltonii FRC-32]|uniref:Transcriptional regulator, Crp/Fnr family n=1 Tax=Geotalea daltonii (strain DSM 22248 / JCM 15807 / FRC-32) TaxID=316067 RepID=B9M2U2_GEODF|nr:Crp/Fnr family transcriptional regulator [Geotalea daltonii]ACM21288.1 transcriptional regulator, Crp/Fnr family [Geotalea daltonii FRC-32]